MSAMVEGQTQQIVDLGGNHVTEKGALRLGVSISSKTPASRFESGWRSEGRSILLAGRDHGESLDTGSIPVPERAGLGGGQF
jgi:hypothetical protein